MTRNIIVIIFALLGIILFGCNNTKQPTAQVDKPLTEQEKLMQEMEKNWVAPFELQIDENIFNKKKMNAYTSDRYDKSAVLVLVLGGVSYADEKAKFEKMQPKEGETVLSKKVEMLNSRETLVYKIKEVREGLELIFHTYTCKGNDNTTIMCTCSCKPEDLSKLEKIFEAAAMSVKLKQ